MGSSVGLLAFSAKFKLLRGLLIGIIVAGLVRWLIGLSYRGGFCRPALMGIWLIRVFLLITWGLNWPAFISSF